MRYSNLQFYDTTTRPSYVFLGQSGRVVAECPGHPNNSRHLFREKCTKKNRQECNNLPKQYCEKVPSEKCEEVEETILAFCHVTKTIPQVKKTSCKSVPKTSCTKKEPTETCRDVPWKSCTTKKSRKVCKNIPQKKCRTSCRKVFWCRTCHNHGHGHSY